MKENFFSPYPKLNSNGVAKKILESLGSEELLRVLREMLLIRHFEARGEFAYQHGLVGGFYHSYAGQEAIQTAALALFGPNNWYITTYRCHALALLLGASPNELMAELYGRKSGNAKGRGGSMHLYAERLLGGFAIVGGHLPIAIGAAFSLKYEKKEGEFAICFLGEGAVAQGAFHESLNLASLWNLPVIFVIENNQWGMGTHVSRAIAVHDIAESFAPAYGLKGFTLNGMDFFNCYAGFQEVKKVALSTSKPVLVECLCERFKGHSISDPGLYRSKEVVAKNLERDPILLLRHFLEKEGLLDEVRFKRIESEEKERVVAAMKFAEESPWPNPVELEEEVFAP